MGGTAGVQVRHVLLPESAELRAFPAQFLLHCGVEFKISSFKTRWLSNIVFCCVVARIFEFGCTHFRSLFRTNMG